MWHSFWHNLGLFVGFIGILGIIFCVIGNFPFWRIKIEKSQENQDTQSFEEV